MSLQRHTESTALSSGLYTVQLWIRLPLDTNAEIMNT